MSDAISTGGERRNRQSEPIARDKRGDLHIRAGGKEHPDQRTGRERRVASYRGWLTDCCDPSDDRYYSEAVNVILALRRPVSVSEEELAEALHDEFNRIYDGPEGYERVWRQVARVAITALSRRG